MFRINKSKNRIDKIQQKTFSELHFKEREHLQEWIANNSDFFGEEMLIIQKEFDGFDDTKERLDLLALDKSGNIVVIENKLDDSGRDVTWQVLKYASYCATLTKNQIKEIYQQYLNRTDSSQDAESLMNEFFEVEDLSEVEFNQSQRLIMVAGNFRKEVTSTVLWLLNNYKVQLQCFKITPYQVDEQLLLSVEQIIPVKEAEDYMISVAKKNKEDQEDQSQRNIVHRQRQEFWELLLDKMNQTESSRFQNISPSKDQWISSSAGVGGIGFSFGVSRSYARVELTLVKSNAEENKYFFDELYKRKETIENNFGQPLEWERLDDKKMSRVKYEKKDVNFYNKDDWPAIMDFMVKYMPKFEKAFSEPLEAVTQKFKSNGLPQS